ncbi:MULTISPECIES: ABC transporter ATP-binding protein [unclassified Colwellia]|uniref:ABC transporter ATP-binding protein n=1 Tax=unclassified Colwellia TaxID=196834 RepID=UPI0015F602D2|nr:MULTISPECIES: ABC transporter ATP-binding protein [unclassified Colwellia]MBA6233781.1 ABC transporter ATP-binding protein [Colwellia sp. MB02u-7]MBA6237403.1 ABC transporter ATP-binding protein [Colwellia sp. MB02u-11]MBA6257153.1 ABC transporter ATP-binding protein [Colwellia sp. MB3u-28]MBA6258738.1 ABC transporter ATP-binding protein [Colwellia sp. MB3u-41]MBA6300403.1 ABC transporter ATP-binding protein [Colwellia sp. MB3u-22]
MEAVAITSGLNIDSNKHSSIENQLKISGLSKTYHNGFRALNNVNLTLANGMFGLLGPNGAGKSSFMRSLATLQTFDNGNIIFNGEDSQANPDAIRKYLGYLPQEFGVYPKMSAVQLLDYLAVLKGVIDKTTRKKQIDYLLELTNLTEHKNKAVANYSGGMKQRFGIAQALLGSPQLLIIDEPTAGLDPAERNSFHNILSDIADKMIILLSTHIVEDINNLCPKMAILNAGEICFQGKPQALISTLQNRLWRKTISKNKLEQVQQQYELLSVRLKSGCYQIRLVSDINPGHGFTPVEADLEDAYFHTLKQQQR